MGADNKPSKPTFEKEYLDKHEKHVVNSNDQSNRARTSTNAANKPNISNHGYSRNLKTNMQSKPPVTPDNKKDEDNGGKKHMETWMKVLIASLCAAVGIGIGTYAVYRHNQVIDATSHVEIEQQVAPNEASTAATTEAPDVGDSVEISSEAETVIEDEADLTEQYKKEAEGYWPDYKDQVTCDEDTFVDYYVNGRIDGLGQGESLANTLNEYAKKKPTEDPSQAQSSSTSSTDQTEEVASEASTETVEPPLYEVEDMEPTVMYTTNAVNARKGPDTSYDKVVTYKKSTSLTAVGRVSSFKGQPTDWYEIKRKDGTMVFVVASYLTTTKPVASSASTTTSTTNTTKSSTNTTTTQSQTSASSSSQSASASTTQPAQQETQQPAQQQPAQQQPAQQQPAPSTEQPAVETNPDDQAFLNSWSDDGNITDSDINFTPSDAGNWQ